MAELCRANTGADRPYGGGVQRSGERSVGREGAQSQSVFTSGEEATRANAPSDYPAAHPQGVQTARSFVRSQVPAQRADRSTDLNRTLLLLSVVDRSGRCG